MVHILTWNIHGAKETSILQLADTLILNHLDVIMLQEVPNRTWANQLGRVLNMTAHFQQTHKNGLGNAVFTSSPVSVVHYTFKKHWFSCAGKRGALAILFDDVTVVCTHFAANPTMVEQWCQARELDKFTQNFGGRHVVIAGDFNAHYFSPATWYLRHKGWRDMWRHASIRKHGYKAGCTFSSTFPFQRIDYIMTNSPRVSCRHAYTLDGAFRRQSDHRGLVANLNWVGRTSHTEK